MNPEHEQWRHETRAALDECFDQIRFARASELARSGRYLEAEGLLSLNGYPSEAPRDLDLLARIAVQQERHSDARHLWETAHQKDPRNPVYEDCLQRLTELQDATSRFDTLLAWLVCATILFSIGALVYAFLPRK
jgi:hypothetical protein